MRAVLVGLAAHGWALAAVGYWSANAAHRGWQRSLATSREILDAWQETLDDNQRLIALAQQTSLSPRKGHGSTEGLTTSVQEVYS